MAVAVNVGGRTMVLEQSMAQAGRDGLLDRYTLVRELCEDLRQGISPYQRLHRAHAWLGLAPRGVAQLEELRFVESLFGVLLGASSWDAEARQGRVDCGGGCAGR